MRNINLLLIIFFYSNILCAAEFKGKFEQGSFIIGKATKGSKIEIDGEEMTVRRVDLDEVLLVADEKPLDETMGLSGVSAKS